jgi:hypothetical protein
VVSGTLLSPGGQGLGQGFPYGFQTFGELEEALPGPLRPVQFLVQKALQGGEDAGKPQEEEPLGLEG